MTSNTNCNTQQEGLEHVGAKPRGWVDAGFGVAGNSDPQLVLHAITDLVTGSGLSTRWVFRGAGDASWPLSSTLYRRIESDLGRTPQEEDVRRSEAHLLKRARDWQLDLGEAGTIPDMHLLARMQHHGAPTRLLDVTCNPMTALWFACASHPDKEGVVFLFNVTGIANFRSIEWEGSVNTWGHMGDPTGWSWTQALAESNGGQPFLVNPTIRDQRMTAQEGMFLSSVVPPENSGDQLLQGMWSPREPDQAIQRMIWNSDGLGVMDAQGKPQDYLPGFTMIAVLIPAVVKKQMSTLLDVTYNRRWETIFPDIAGYCGAVSDGTVPLFPS